MDDKIQNDKIQGIVNQLSSYKPPPPPVKMEITEYIELLERIKNSDPKLQEDVLKALSEFQAKLDIEAEALASKLRVMFRMKPKLF